MSVDVDDCWAYLKTSGATTEAERPSYLSTFVPRVLRALGDFDIRGTFFLVGEDVLRPENGETLTPIGRAGHEYANHSFSHDPWLPSYDIDVLEADIAQAEMAIECVLGTRPIGFRAPGFAWSVQLLHVLRKRGYLYDASVLPTFVGPLSRRWLLARVPMGSVEREQRQHLFGAWTNGFLPNRPHPWRFDEGPAILEIPVTVAPVIRTPMHLSYLQYLAQLSWKATERYLALALMGCAATQTPLSFLVHPLDFFGGDEVDPLKHYPGMRPSSAFKRRVTTRVLEILSRHCHFVKMSDIAATCLRAM